MKHIEVDEKVNIFYKVQNKEGKGARTNSALKSSA